MAKKFIFGHKNPDTDTITSAIVYADLKSKIGEEVEPVRLGEVNGETQFALEQFGVEAPRLIKKASDEVEQVILVDHNERQQSIDDIDQVQVTEVIDHHRIANFETQGPLYYRAEPVGCTATILNKLYKEHNVEVSKQMAGLMVSAIISDSLLFKSPTCTEEDVAAAKELEKIAGIDAEKYGLDMLKAGADISDKTMAELISLDAKNFDMGGSNVEVAQVNTVDTSEVLENQADIEAEMQKAIDEKGLDLFVFVVTDILSNDSTAVVLGGKSAAVEKAFDVTLSENKAVLEGVVSRKKQIVPPLTEALSS
ncbi:manganese-dependent inorganic pyrophosphatase [Thalassobacillus devorans]|uniref:Probable manganese-dependent inorganic pyrophosphatase n=1 Tax=Thalassobacillus devorans TaxID=279813 RepID=A0ABQ1NQX5_9BACI|nr:manganese-dependent inorganic pyrophosphatase [Thalassobacillus devorans]NIK28845.1 manganese-dependent inorganic pyrophosphatase [Thalassobacillus devorans]GGC83110.1 manganese-dependent inorganic pyrophosphatase [Thalassobacillus devorans]